MAKPGRGSERASSQWLQGAQRNRSAGMRGAQLGDSASARPPAEHAVYQSGLKLKGALGDTPQDVEPDMYSCLASFFFLKPKKEMNARVGGKR
jgi:hypothetical protein